MQITRGLMVAQVWAALSTHKPPFEDNDAAMATTDVSRCLVVLEKLGPDFEVATDDIRQLLQLVEQQQKDEGEEDEEESEVQITRLDTKGPEASSNIEGTTTTHYECAEKEPWREMDELRNLFKEFFEIFIVCGPLWEAILVLLIFGRDMLDMALGRKRRQHDEEVPIGSEDYERS